MVRHWNFLIANYLDLAVPVVPQIRGGNTLVQDFLEMDYPTNALLYLEILAQLMVRHWYFLIVNYLDLAIPAEAQIRGGGGNQVSKNTA